MEHKTFRFRRLYNPGPARSLWGDVLNFLFLCLVGAFMALPLIYTVNNAFKPLDELLVYPPKFFVRHPTLDNFTNIRNLMAGSYITFSRYLFNTVYITLVATFFHIITASMAAYVLEKRKFPGSRLFFRVVVLSLMFSTAVTSIPNYLIMTRMGIINTYASLILPSISAPIGLYLMKQFMASSIPDSLLEAARIDGAKEIDIFFRIVMPLVKPAWLTLILFTFQRMWGATGDTFIFSEKLKPLTYALNQIVSGGIARAGVGAAVSFLMLLPPICVFVFSQSRIMDTMATSGIKE